MNNCAVVHGSITTRGGAERVAEEIASAIDAPLYVGFSNNDCLVRNDINYIPLFNSKIANLFNKRGSLRDMYHFWNWQYRPELTDYDTIIISGNEANWYVPTENQKIIRYIHHPPHTAYDYYHRRASNPLTRIYTLAIRTLIYHTLPFTDTYISCSEVVANRIKQYWGVDSTVIYPPVDINEYNINPHKNRDDYYLIISRLVPRKRVEYAVNVFNKNPDKSLIIVGEGSERKRLENLASDNIKFEGYVSENRKKELLENSIALIMPTINEDFGIVPVEAMASGTPVIGVNEGFTSYHIDNNNTGLLYTHGELEEYIKNYNIKNINYDAESISKTVEKYSINNFHKQIRDII